MPSKTMNDQSNAREDGKVDSNAGQEEAHASKSDREKAMSCIEYWEDPEHLSQNQKEYKKFKSEEQKSASVSSDNDDQQHSDDDDDNDDDDGAASTTIKKRGRGANAPKSSKKQKSAGRNDSPIGAAGDKTRVPKQGQKVQWKSIAGYVDGEVVEVLYEEKKVEGEFVKASKEDPRVVLKSGVSGEVCVHEPDAVYWE